MVIDRMRASVGGGAGHRPGGWIMAAAAALLLLAATGLAQLGRATDRVAPIPEAPQNPVPMAAPAPVATTTPFIVAAERIADARPPRPTPAFTPIASDLSSDTRQRLGASLQRVKGSVLERSFRSEALAREMPYVIYLPPGFGQTAERYPVLYILHGRGGARVDWVTSGLLEVADRGMQSGQTTQMLIVSPEGYDGYWTNHAGASSGWGDYVVRDLVAHIDATYPTLPRAAARAIGGESMGGWGALHLAFTHPEVFGVVGAHSPALRPDDGSLAFLGTGAEFARKDPISLARQLSAASPLKIWLDTGRDDPWASRATLLHTILAQRGVAHAWNVFPGGHNWSYWRAHAADYVRFYSQSLALTDAPP
jgi:enterochelin esterase-like enzyme